MEGAPKSAALAEGQVRPAWQVVPAVLPKLLSDAGEAARDRVMNALLKMKNSICGQLRTPTRAALSAALLRGSKTFSAKRCC